VFAAVDVHYLSSGGARAAAVVAADAAFSDVLAERFAVVPEVLPYRPGEFYRRPRWCGGVAARIASREHSWVRASSY
jgi:deoxyinosine 3'endonuclease (endonuclease V)